MQNIQAKKREGHECNEKHKAGMRSVYSDMQCQWLFKTVDPFLLHTSKSLCAGSERGRIVVLPILCVYTHIKS